MQLFYSLMPNRRCSPDSQTAGETLSRYFIQKGFDCLESLFANIGLECLDVADILAGKHDRFFDNLHLYLATHRSMGYQHVSRNRDFFLKYDKIEQIEKVVNAFIRREEAAPDRKIVQHRFDNGYCLFRLMNPYSILLERRASGYFGLFPSDLMRRITNGDVIFLTLRDQFDTPILQITVDAASGRPLRPFHRYGIIPNVPITVAFHDSDGRTFIEDPSVYRMISLSDRDKTLLQTWMRSTLNFYVSPFAQDQTPIEDGLDSDELNDDQMDDEEEVALRF